MPNLDDAATVDSAHVPSATAQKGSMAKKFKRNQKPITAQAKPSRRRGKGLHMKIGSDGSMTVRHMSDTDRCLAIMQPVEIDLASLAD